MADQHDPNCKPGIVRRFGEDARAAAVSRIVTILVSVGAGIVVPLLVPQMNHVAKTVDDIGRSVARIETELAVQGEQWKALGARVDTVEAEQRDHEARLQDHDRRLTRIEALQSAGAKR